MSSYIDRLIERDERVSDGPMQVSLQLRRQLALLCACGRAQLIGLAELLEDDAEVAAMAAKEDDWRTGESAVRSAEVAEASAAGGRLMRALAAFAPALDGP